MRSRTGFLPSKVGFAHKFFRSKGPTTTIQVIEHYKRIRLICGFIVMINLPRYASEKSVSFKFALLNVVPDNTAFLNMAPVRSDSSNTALLQIS